MASAKGNNYYKYKQADGAAYLLAARVANGRRPLSHIRLNSPALRQTASSGWVLAIQGAIAYSEHSSGVAEHSNQFEHVTRWGGDGYRERT